MLITYTSIVLMTQAGFLSANTVYLAHLKISIGKYLTFQTFKKESKKMDQISLINA